MAENSKIEWTDHTWSPWEGCTKVSPGCDHCYAEGMNRWLRKGANWGPGAPRREYSDEHWKKPLRWNAAAQKAGTHPKVFPSVCDPFDNAVSNTMRSKFIGLLWDTPDLIWLLLTKRIGNVQALLEECTEPGKEWRDTLPPNVRLGATMVNQEEWDRDSDKLLSLGVPNFVSLEPLLGPIDMRGKRPDWVIVGGESGREARPMHPDWAMSLRDQCEAARVPFLFKQIGDAVPVSTEVDCDHGRTVYALDVDVELPGERYRVHEHDGLLFVRVPNKAAGRLLDGLEHNGFPEGRTP